MILNYSDRIENYFKTSSLIFYDQFCVYTFFLWENFAFMLITPKIWLFFYIVVYFTDQLEFFFLFWFHHRQCMLIKSIEMMKLIHQIVKKQICMVDYVFLLAWNLVDFALSCYILTCNGLSTTTTSPRPPLPHPHPHSQLLYFYCIWFSIK